MEKAIELCQKLHDDGVFLFNRALPFSAQGTKAATIRLCQGTWGIFIDSSRIETTAEANTILLHEYGHYATGATHEVCSPYDLIEKHEYKANKWAVLEALTEEELDQAVADGFTDIWSLAERFDLTEDFMRKVVCWHTYGNLAAELYF